jgi:hypothetical protein
MAGKETGKETDAADVADEQGVLDLVVVDTGCDWGISWGPGCV